MSDSAAPIFPTSDDDPEMDEATKQARLTFRFFWRELAWEQRRIVPGLDLAAIKASLSDPPGTQSATDDGFNVEHMWLLEVDFDGREISGTLINTPHSLTTFQEGDRVTITGKQLCDWLYVVSGDVYGGFTVDVLRSRMSKRDRKQHDAAWGFDFGDVGVVNLVPPEYLGEAPAKKGLLAKLGGGASQSQEFATVAAVEHPMSINMRGSLQQALNDDPTFLKQADAKGFTLLHQLSLAGSLDGVEVCLAHGADPNQATSRGLTAFALAKSLGWQRVMERLQQAGGR